MYRRMFEDSEWYYLIKFGIKDFELFMSSLEVKYNSCSTIQVQRAICVESQTTPTKLQPMYTKLKLVLEGY